MAGACSGVGPAYWALLVEARVDAAVKAGMPAALAVDAGAPRRWPARPSCSVRAAATRSPMRREVASPGGTTARGLAALERGGVRAAFASAMDDVVGD